MKAYKSGKIVDLSEEEVRELEQINYDIMVKSVRHDRDVLLKETVDPLVSNPLRWEELSVEEQEKVRVYRRELLDVPQQEGYPDNVVWPTLELGA